MSSKKLNPFKDFQSDQIQRSSRKIFTAHYPCRNAALNLTPVTGTNNGFISEIINSLIESWGVRLTWFDCNSLLQVVLPDEICVLVKVLSNDFSTELTWRQSPRDIATLIQEERGGTCSSSSLHPRWSTPDFKWQGWSKDILGFEIFDFGIFWGRKILVSIVWVAWF